MSDIFGNLIRKAGRDDIATISSLAHAIWPNAYGEILTGEQITYMLDLFYSHASLEAQMKKDQFLIVETDDRPLGFASFSLTEEPGIYKLHKLYVQTNMQGAGLGKQLIGYILDELRQLNATALLLDVNRNNKARFFYEKLGFVIIKEQDKDIGNNFWMNDYVMRLML